MEKGIQIGKADNPQVMAYNVRPEDRRIKSYFEVVNTTATPHIILPIIAMSDGGSTGTLTLPARKIDMLGLAPIEGKAGRTSVTGVVMGATSVKLSFQPFVVVKFYFSRGEGKEIETREVATFATCHEAEYQKYMATKLAEGTTMMPGVSAEGAASVELPVTPTPPITAEAVAAPTTPPSTAIAKVVLSPTYHSPVDRPQQQVALGQDLLGKLAVHADFANSVLWVVEEVPSEEW